MATDNRWIVVYDKISLVRIPATQKQWMRDQPCEVWEYGRGPIHVVLGPLYVQNKRFIYFAYSRVAEVAG